MVKKKRKYKGKTRPARIFIKGNKLYIQVGKRKILLKDAKNYRKSDIIDTLLEQLLIRRKRRKKGKITRKEKKLNRNDLRIFNEFEKMNKNQSKGSLKIPFSTSLGPKEALFYNAIMQFVKTLPKKDVNIQVQEDITKSAEKSKLKEKAVEKSKSKKKPQSIGTQVQSIPQSIGTQASFQDPNITVELERLRQEGELKDKTIEQQNKVGIILNDLNNFDKMGSKKKNKLILKKWQERFEADSGSKIDLGRSETGRKKSWNNVTTKEYLEKIIQAYGGFSNIDTIFTDYGQYRRDLFDIPEEEKKTLQIEEVSESESGTESESESGTESESESGTEYKEFIEETDSKDNPEIAQAATAVLEQVANGSAYTGKGLTTMEINDIIAPILGDMYLGTLPSNFNKFLPKKLNGDKFGFVMNTDPSSKEGKHWVGVLIDLDDDLSLEYFDSFGKDPDKKFMKEIKKLIDKLKPNSYLKFKINKVQVQDNKSQNCGFFAMKFLLDRLLNGLTFKQATGYKNEIVDDSIQGERNIKSLKNKFGYI